MKQIARIVLVGALILAVAACGGASASPAPSGSALHPKIDQARATELATVALEAYNRGDYTAFSTSWSTAMTSAIGPDAFAKFRQDTLSTLGSYVAIDGVELVPAKTAGFVKYVFHVSCSKAKATYSIVFAEEGELIEGSSLAPA